MRDTLTESPYYPSGLLEAASLGAVLCVAPHPDDEILGPGGLLALLADAGLPPSVVILSRGERAAADAAPDALAGDLVDDPPGHPADDMAGVRTDESLRAAQALGVPAPRFLDWPDRGMRYGAPLIDAIAAQIEAAAPRTLLLPALSEPHPDHQAVALAGIAAVLRGGPVGSVLFYEVGAPTHPNALVDITAVAERKWRALAQFASQEALQPYAAQARAMASLRAFGRGPVCTAAEAFFRVEAEALRRDGPGAALPAWPLQRQALGAAVAPRQLPLVSVLVRSMDRPQLPEAIASIAAQTYPNLEVVVVNATGREHGPVSWPDKRMALHVVGPSDAAGAPVRCDRAAAANLALAAARGELALFLDDDDLLAPQHVERLVDALARAPAAVAAYGGVRVEGPDGVLVRDYDLPWSRHRLDGINFLPIHAVLFRADRVRERGLRFDESLPVLEDWQFWRALAGLGEFVHCPGVSASYRQAHGESGIGDPAHPNHWLAWHRRLVERGIASKPAGELADDLAWHAIELDRQQARADHLERAMREAAVRFEATLREANARFDATLRDANAHFAAERAKLEEVAVRQGDAHAVAEELRKQIRQMESSRSWRITGPLRALTGLTQRLFGRRD